MSPRSMSVHQARQVQELAEKNRLAVSSMQGRSSQVTLGNATSLREATYAQSAELRALARSVEEQFRDERREVEEEAVRFLMKREVELASQAQRGVRRHEPPPLIKHAVPDLVYRPGDMSPTKESARGQDMPPRDVSSLSVSVSDCPLMLETCQFYQRKSQQR
jgi:hypothetical protein